MNYLLLKGLNQIILHLQKSQSFSPPFSIFWLICTYLLTNCLYFILFFRFSFCWIFFYLFTVIVFYNPILFFLRHLLQILKLLSLNSPPLIIFFYPHSLHQHIALILSNISKLYQIILFLILHCF